MPEVFDANLYVSLIPEEPHPAQLMRSTLQDINSDQAADSLLDSCTEEKMVDVLKEVERADQYIDLIAAQYGEGNRGDDLRQSEDTTKKWIFYQPKTEPVQETTKKWIFYRSKSDDPNGLPQQSNPWSTDLWSTDLWSLDLASRLHTTEYQTFDSSFRIQWPDTTFDYIGNTRLLHSPYQYRRSFERAASTPQMNADDIWNLGAQAKQISRDRRKNEVLVIARSVAKVMGVGCIAVAATLGICLLFKDEVDQAKGKGLIDDTTPLTDFNTLSPEEKHRIQELFSLPVQ